MLPLMQDLLIASPRYGIPSGIELASVGVSLTEDEVSIIDIPLDWREIDATVSPGVLKIHILVQRYR